MQVVFMCHRMNSQQYCSLGNIHVLLDGSVDGSVDSQWSEMKEDYSGVATKSSFF